MTVATMTDSSIDPSATSYNTRHRTTLSHLRRTPTRALLWIFILGASVNLLVSTALRLTSNDARLFYPYSTVLLVISTVPALVMLFFGENTASRELAERYAGLTGRDIWRTHISTARRMLVMSVPYALICAGCELIIAGGTAEPANIWSNFSAPIRWALLPAIITLSYFLGASMGAIKLRYPTCSSVAVVVAGMAFSIGLPAYSMPLTHFRRMFPIAFPALPPLSSLTAFSVQFIVMILVLGFITCRQLILRTPPLRQPSLTHDQ